MISLGVCLLLCGGTLAVRRPRNPLGWLFLSAALTAILLPSATNAVLAAALLVFPTTRSLRVPTAAAAVLLASLLYADPGLTSLLAVLAAVAALVTRYRCGDEVVRRQILWLYLAAVLAVPLVLLGLSAWLAVPPAVALALLRYRLVDVRVVASQATFYLCAGVVLSAVPSVVALLVIPAHWLFQPLLDRAFRVKVPALDLEQGSLDVLVRAVRDALQLPFVALRMEGRDLAVSGSATGQLEVVELGAVQFVTTGRLGRRRRRLLSMLEVPLGVAVRATLASEELQASRERIVAAREEERRRLRRDLHDNLGPRLTGMAYTTDALRNHSSDGRQAEMLGRLRGDIGLAITEIRAAVEGLRPPALDELGLGDAVRAVAGRFAHRAGGEPVTVRVETSVGWADLPAAVEVAAYRIVVEALNNAVKHSGANLIEVHLAIGDELSIEVTDNGEPAEWLPGVGLLSMTERAAEIGGHCTAGHTPTGGRVLATLPLCPMAPHEAQPGTGPTTPSAATRSATSAATRCAPTTASSRSSTPPAPR
ncbi:hypothetical protein GCM10029976_009640 [Kribbella albertanoniae]|uniref:histidine kinase n=1 Tax=Kribbella albertanoniae TaxID=1266829 RepID=A0A4R4QEV3_9ACTN|nr:histidine kinase [Kribbella albertanoniae]TDC33652.1 hypothetical protein E1261_05485 [Kribbella albertanoniae]